MHRAIQLKVRGIQKHHDVQHIHLFINTQNTLYVLSEIVQAKMSMSIPINPVLHKKLVVQIQ